MTKKAPELYKRGQNAWQNKVFAHMTDYLEKKGVTRFGSTFKGNQYKHLLTDDDQKQNFINDEIYEATKERFTDHKAGDFKRVSTNTAASQAYCFNLFVPLNQNKTLASNLFSNLFGKTVSVKHIEIEFTPNTLTELNGFNRTTDESIGDQGAKIGTDADVAIFYTYADNRKGVLLIEFKFIEAKFSICSSYKRKMEIRSVCDSPDFYNKMVEDKAKDGLRYFLCGYNKYENWGLTKKSKFISQSEIVASQKCPFRHSLNQLWRNVLLAEKVTKARKLDEFGFWVFSPKENDKYLWDKGCLDEEFRQLLTFYGKDHFKKFHLEEVLSYLDEEDLNNNERAWMIGMKEKYLVI